MLEHTSQYNDNVAKSVIRPGLIFNLIKHFAVHWQMVVTWQDKDRVENENRSELAGVTKQEASRAWQFFEFLDAKALASVLDDDWSRRVAYVLRQMVRKLATYLSLAPIPLPQ